MGWSIEQVKQDGEWLAKLYNGDELVAVEGRLGRRMTKREREAWLGLHREKHRRNQLALNVPWDAAMLDAGRSLFGMKFAPEHALVGQVEDIEDALGRNHSWSKMPDWSKG